jgi:DNA (cytosine-5)-methyltransferase 1
MVITFHSGKVGAAMLRVLDLFAGTGGLATGFRSAGFCVAGVDIEPATRQIFEMNNLGEAITADLMKENVSRSFEGTPVVVGGPPCRPWSSLNITRRGSNHPDSKLLDVFFQYVFEVQPEFFLMENVPLLRNDERYRCGIEDVSKNGYSVDCRVIRYSDFGAPIARRRLFTFGARHSSHGAIEFFLRLEASRTMPQTVGEAIAWLRQVPRGHYPDHIWPQLNTISNYEKYYINGKYGWYRLGYESPSPSFGNIMKTYILHPEAGQNGFPLRVISVREAMCIMGFDREFRLPENLAMSKKYQMVADAVSPVVAKVCARIIAEMLDGGSR